MSTFRMNRRRFLAGAAGVTVTIPVLGSLLRSSQAAPGDSDIKRLVVFYTANGHHRDQWLPSGGETDFTLPPLLASLEPYRSKINILHGLGGDSGHFAGHSECLTGRTNHDDTSAKGGPSLDQLLAEGLKDKTPIASLELGVGAPARSGGIISYSSSDLPIPPLNSGPGAFDRVVGAVDFDPEVANRLRAQQRSVLDAVMDDYKAVNAQLGTEEKHLLDAHLSLLRDQETKLSQPAVPIDCELPDAPPPGVDAPATLTAHAESIGAAFRCDVSRVATIVMGHSGFPGHYSFLPNAGADFHEAAHGTLGNAYEVMEAVDTWHAEMFSYLLGVLDNIPEGNGTVLDNTLVLWTNEIGLHEHSHSRASMGLVLAGGGAGHIQTGRFRDLSGYHYQDLLLTMGQVLADESLTRFGDEGRKTITELLV